MGEARRGPALLHPPQATAFDDAVVPRFYTALAREGVLVSNGAWFGDSPRVFRVGVGRLAVPEHDQALRARYVCHGRTRIGAARGVLLCPR